MDVEAEASPRSPSNALPGEVILLSWVSFFADVSSEMIYPLLPILVVGVMGASTTSLGWIEGLAVACVALLTAWSGWRSDARGSRAARRVPWVRAGYALPVLGRTIVAFAPAWGWVLAGRLVDRVGKGIRNAPRDALLADVTPAHLLGRAFGFHRFMDTLGALLGVLISAGLLYTLIPTVPPDVGQPSSGLAPGSYAGHATTIRWIVGIGAFLALASAVLTLRVREAPGHAKPAPTPPMPADPSGSHERLSPAFWRAVVVMTIFSIANGTDVFILLRLADIGMSPWVVVMAYALFNLVYALGSYPAGILSDRLGRRRIILIGWVVYAAVYALLALMVPGSSAWMLASWGIMALYGAYTAMTEGVGKALAADVAPRARRGTAMGILAMAMGLGTLVGSVITGYLWHRAGAPWAFGTSAALALVAAALGMVLLPSPRTATRR